MFPELMAISAATLVGGMDILRKKGLLRSNPITGMLITVVVNLLVSWPLMLFFAIPELYQLQIRAILLFAAGGLLGSVISRWCNFVGSDRIGPSTSRSITSSRPIITTLLAILTLNENVTFPVLTGTFLVVLGLVCISLRGQGRARARWRRIDLAFPFLGILFGSSASILRKEALRTTGTILGNAINSTVALIGVTSFLSLSGKRERIKLDKESALLFFMSGIALSSAVLLSFEALRTGTVSTVVPIMNISPFFTLIFSYLFLKDVEHLTSITVIGAIMTVAGATLISIF